MFQLCLGPFLFLIFVELTGGGNVAPMLCLELKTTTADYLEGVPVEVEVTLKNCGQTYLVVPPRVFPEASGVEPEPWGILTFKIEPAKGGPPVSYSGAWPETKLRLPSPSDYLVLGPGYFYGLKVSLSEGAFKYSIQRKNSYQIVATLTTSAREWIAKNYSAELPHFEVSRVLTGASLSNAITITFK